MGLAANLSFPPIRQLHKQANSRDCFKARLPSGETLKIYGLKALDIASKIVLEAAKVTAAVAVLTLFAVCFLPPTPLVFFAVVLAPLAEEIVFRGILQNAIRLAQVGYNRLIKAHPPTERELMVQKICRIGVTAIVFGLVHLTNPARSWVQVLVATWGGVVLGTLMERTQTLALPILEHGLWNGLVTLSICTYPVAGPVLLLGVTIFNIFALSTKRIPVSGQIVYGLKNAGEAVLKKIDAVYHRKIEMPLELPALAA